MNFHYAVDLLNTPNEYLILDDEKEKYLSIFAVINTDQGPGTKFLTLSSGKHSTEITTKSITSDLSNEQVFLNSTKGNIINYSRSFKNNSKSVKITLNHNNYNDDPILNLMELIILPQIPANKERRKVETYFAIKYGISLKEDCDYITSADSIIWKAELNKDFNYRITGIGRDDTFRLNQKQSSNISEPGLIIGLNQILPLNDLNQGKLNDQTYLMWGDNNASKKFETTENNKIKIIKRKWKASIFSNDKYGLEDLQIKIQPGILFEEFEENNNDYLWFVHFDSVNQNLNNASYYDRGLKIDSFNVYSNITLLNTSSKHSYFSFIKAPRFFILPSTEVIDCTANDETTLNIKMIGGVPPYKININSISFADTISTLSDNIEFKGLKSGSYTLSIIDNINQLVTDTISIQTESEFGIKVDKIWTLNKDNNCTLFPQILKDDIIYTFEWMYGNEVISYEPTITVTNSGIYTLSAFNHKEGCQKHFYLIVYEDSTEHDLIVISPNPTKSKTNFTIDINIPEETDIQLFYYDVNGKLIKFKKLKHVKQGSYIESLSEPGVYFLNIQLLNKSVIKKIICM
jgi:hypothetical protein